MNFDWWGFGFLMAWLILLALGVHFDMLRKPAYKSYWVWAAVICLAISYII